MVYTVTTVLHELSIIITNSIARVHNQLSFTKLMNVRKENCVNTQINDLEAMLIHTLNIHTIFTGFITLYKHILPCVGSRTTFRPMCWSKRARVPPVQAESPLLQLYVAEGRR